MDGRHSYRRGEEREREETLLAVAGQDPARHPKSSPKVYGHGMLSSALDRHGQPRAPSLALSDATVLPMDSGRVKEMTSDTSHQRPAGSSNHAQAGTLSTPWAAEQRMVHCKAPGGCNRHKAARGSGSHRASSCVLISAKFPGSRACSCP